MSDKDIPLSSPTDLLVHCWVRSVQARWPDQSLWCRPSVSLWRNGACTVRQTREETFWRSIHRPARVWWPRFPGALLCLWLIWGHEGESQVSNAQVKCLSTVSNICSIIPDFITFAGNMLQRYSAPMMCATTLWLRPSRFWTTRQWCKMSAKFWRGRSTAFRVPSIESQTCDSTDGIQWLMPTLNRLQLTGNVGLDSGLLP